MELTITITISSVLWFRRANVPRAGISRRVHSRKVELHDSWEGETQEVQRVMWQRFLLPTEENQVSKGPTLLSQRNSLRPRHARHSKVLLQEHLQLRSIVRPHLSGCAALCLYYSWLTDSLFVSFSISFFLSLSLTPLFVSMYLSLSMSTSVTLSIWL